MIGCPLCGRKDAKEILSRPETALWTNSPDDEQPALKHRCLILQCPGCGHVFQPMTIELSGALERLYSSKQAYLSTPMGRGNWGLARADHFLSEFAGMADLNRFRSVLEIGCADGFLLRHMKSTFPFLEDLVGIEPSLSESIQFDGVSLLKDFASAEMELGRCFDLIFSAGVFEHIEKINEVMTFCGRHLKENGNLFFCVPDAEGQLLSGDPALFTHQHAHCFTEDSVGRLLANHGFELSRLVKKRDSLKVFARKGRRVRAEKRKAVSYGDYSRKLDRNLDRIDHTLSAGREVIVHGANNSLNNILHWLGKDYSFSLVDNDITKHGRSYFGKIVHPIEEIDLAGHETLLIVPSAFFGTIYSDYRNRGFRGNIESAAERADERPE